MNLKHVSASCTPLTLQLQDNIKPVGVAVLETSGAVIDIVPNDITGSFVAAVYGVGADIVPTDIVPNDLVVAVDSVYGPLKVMQGLPEVVKTMEALCSESGADSREERQKARMEMMANMLAESLLSGDAIFSRVARAVYLALRAIVLCGSSEHGRSLAEAELNPACWCCSNF